MTLEDYKKEKRSLIYVGPVQIKLDPNKISSTLTIDKFFDTNIYGNKNLEQNIERDSAICSLCNIIDEIRKRNPACLKEPLAKFLKYDPGKDLNVVKFIFSKSEDMLELIINYDFL